MAKKPLIIPILVFMLFLIVPYIHAATVHGIVYDASLNRAENVIVEVSSVPKQIYVSKEGSYSFSLPSGDYTIKAIYQLNYDRYTAQQNITIREDGDYVLDMILFPDITEENELLDEDINPDNIYTGERGFRLVWYLTVILAILSLIAAAFLLFKRKKQNKKPAVNVEETDETKAIVKFIKDNGGRVTQKDIRKNFPVSEAKISLLISELEDKGTIKKIKRGKGNIILLAKFD